MNVSTQKQSSGDTPSDSGNHPAPGRYHVVVKSVDDSHAEHPRGIPTEFEVLAGTVPGQVGKTAIEIFDYDPGDKACAPDQITRMIQACGLLEEDEEKTMDIRDAVGKQLVIELVEFNYVDKSGEKRKAVKIDRSDGGTWRLGHLAVRDVPTRKSDLSSALTDCD